MNYDEMNFRKVKDLLDKTQSDEKSKLYIKNMRELEEKLEEKKN